MDSGLLFFPVLSRRTLFMFRKQPGKMTLAEIPAGRRDLLDGLIGGN